MRVLAQVQRQVLTIPASAIERGPDGLFTYGCRRTRASPSPPSPTGAASNDVVVVESGLKAGERVVASNQYRLQPGSRIRANSPRAASGPGSKTPAGAP